MATSDAPPIPSIDFFTSSIVAILEPCESRTTLPSNSANLAPMVISEVFTINLPQPPSVMVAYVLTIKYCNFAPAAISQFTAIEFVVCHIPSVLLF